MGRFDALIRSDIDDKRETTSEPNTPTNKPTVKEVKLSPPKHNPESISNSGAPTEKSIHSPKEIKPEIMKSRYYDAASLSENMAEKPVKYSTLLYTTTKNKLKHY